MIGKETLVIDSKNFLAGMGSSDTANDAGFSPASTGTNIVTTPGVFRNWPAATAVTGTLTSNIISSCEYFGGNVSSVRRAFLGLGGKFMDLVGTTLTTYQTGAKTYTQDKAQIVAYNGAYYASSDNDITFWDGTATAGTAHFDETFWSVTKGAGTMGSNNPHPMLVFNNVLYIADGSRLYTYDGTTASTSGARTVNLGTNFVIYALGIDPGSGNMLMSVQTAVSGSLSISTVSAVFQYDGSSGNPNKRVVTNDTVTAFQPVAGTVYCAMGQHVGYWNGSGVEVTRKLENVSFVAGYLNTRLKITAVGATLYVCDSNNILAYGPIKAGAQKVWYHVYKPSGLVSNPIGLICNIGSGQLGVFYQDDSSTRHLEVFDLTTNGSSGSNSGGYFVSNRYEFPRPIFIRKVRLFTTGAATTAGTGTVNITNENGSTVRASDFQFVVTSAESPKNVFDFDFNVKLQMARLQIQLPSQTTGLYRAVVYYDAAE